MQYKTGLIFSEGLVEEEGFGLKYKRESQILLLDRAKGLSSANWTSMVSR